MHTDPCYVQRRQHFADLHPVFGLGNSHLRQLLVRFSVLKAYFVGIWHRRHLRGYNDGSSGCRGFTGRFGCGFNSTLLVHRDESIRILVTYNDVNSFSDLHPVFGLGNSHLRQFLVWFGVLQAYFIGIWYRRHLRCDNDGSNGCRGFHRGFTSTSLGNVFHYPCLCIYGNINRFVSLESVLSLRNPRRNITVGDVILIRHYKLVCVYDISYLTGYYFCPRWWFRGADSRTFTTITAFKHVVKYFLNFGKSTENVVLCHGICTRGCP
nr:hypothetical protein a141L - Chlorella virus PBCV-1 [Paramecium bursaria Chlorella virus 1]